MYTCFALSYFPFVYRIVPLVISSEGSSHASCVADVEQYALGEEGPTWCSEAIQNLELVLQLSEQNCYRAVRAISRLKSVGSI